jgi:hypothetical protein
LGNINKFFCKPASAATTIAIPSPTPTNQIDANRLAHTRKDVSRVVGRLGPCSGCREDATVEQAKAAGRTAKAYKICYVSQL